MKKLTLILAITIASVFTFSSCDNDDDVMETMLPTQDLVQIAQANGFNSLAAALTRAGLVDALQGNSFLTVFAPTDAAFATLLEAIGQTSIDDVPVSVLQSILKYHVISGKVLSSGINDAEATTLSEEKISISTSGGIKINGAEVISPFDVEASNGVVHTINQVLVPPSIAPLVNSVLEPAYFNKDFSKLVEAVVKAELVETLLTTPDLTIFAPNNAAFDASGIDPTSLDKETLVSVLTYHVVGAKVLSSGIPAEAATLNGNKLNFSLTGSGNFINGSTEIVAVDIESGSGVVHVIDMVLLPPAGNIVTTAVELTASGEFTSLVAALERTANEGTPEQNLLAVLSSDGPFTVFAPTNDAFQAAIDSKSSWNSLSDIPLETLIDILTYHVVPARAYSVDLAGAVDGNSELMTANGENITMDLENLTINGNSGIVAVNTNTTNGVIHVIDNVLIPSNVSIEPTMDIVETAVASGFNSLAAALTRADLIGALQGSGPFTVFAPTDAAFDALLAAIGQTSIDDVPISVLQDILLYHVVEGKVASSMISDGNVPTLSDEDINLSTSNGIQVNGISVINPFDVDATNGIVHTIDQVLVPSTVTPFVNSVLEPAYFNVNFSKLIEAAVKAGVVETLLTTPDLTIFAPTNDAFDASGIDPASIDAGTLASVLTYHVVGAKVLSSGIPAEAATLNGNKLNFSLTGSGNFINGSTEIVAVDIESGSGVVHVIDMVLLPPAGDIVTTAVELTSSGEFTSLVAALERTANEGTAEQNLLTVLGGDGPFTVFAPTNAAFQALLDSNVNWNTLADIPLETLIAVLTYHVVPARAYSVDLAGAVDNNNQLPTAKGENITMNLENLTINGSSGIIGVNTNTTNGVIHVIDEVLVPSTVPTMDIVEMAVANGFNSLAAALTRADLIGALQGAGPFTVFAPTDAAFADLLSAIGQTSVDDVPVSVLQDILLYHVVEGSVSSSMVSDGEVPTLSDENISLSTSNGIMVNGATVISPFDVGATNGIIHTIDQVLVPSTVTPFVNSVLEPAYFNVNFSKLIEAAVKAGVVETLLATPDLTIFAPTNDAFDASGIDPASIDAGTLASVLTYHVVGAKVLSSGIPAEAGTLNGNKLNFSLTGSGNFINGSTEIVAVDIESGSGVVHVIDMVLLPPTGDIVTTAVELTSSGEFTSLVAALERTANEGTAEQNLLTVLGGDGPFTVFAPTNAAFQALLDSNDDWSVLEDIPLDTLIAVLTYHVVPARAYSVDLAGAVDNNNQLPTANGAMLTFDLENLTINTDTAIIGVNTNATNGVIHVIDKVLVP